MPVKQGTFGTSPIYNGEYKIGKIYNGENLVYQSVEYPTMIAYVQRVDYSGVDQTKFAKIEHGNYVRISVSSLSEGEILTFSYGNVTKEVSANGQVLFGEVEGVDDGTPTVGWLTVKSNLLETTANVKLFGIESGSTSSTYCSTSAIAGDVIKGNYAFSGLMGYKHTNAYGYYPTQLIFETTKTYGPSLVVQSTASGASATVTDIVLGNNTSTLYNNSFGYISGSVPYKNITFTNKTNKPINIMNLAFNVKTASQYNVYTYDNDSVLEYDWTGNNSGATVYNNGVVVSPITAPTVSVSGDNLVITPVSGATRYIITVQVNLINYVTKIDNPSSYTIPISSLEGASGMTSGTSYTLNIQAYGKGYLTSAKTSVSYTKS